MKAFMEEYGVIVVAAIVIMIIVVAASPIGDSIKSGIMEAVQKLTNALADANGISFREAYNRILDCWETGR